VSRTHDGFNGLFIPHITPFDESGALDLDSLARVARHFASTEGVAGLVSCARIGEGPVLSLEEKRQVFQTVGSVTRATGLKHIAAIMPQYTDEAIAMVRELEQQPVDAAMIFPPLLLAWGKVTPDIRVGFWEDLARQTSLPLVLFQIPVASYWYTPEEICRIARLEQVVAFKEASFNIQLYSETVRQLNRQGASMRVLTGNDRFVIESYLLGASGALIGVANVAAHRWVALDLAARAGRTQEALAIQEELAEIKELVFAEPIVEAVSRIKLVLQEDGLIASATVRRPQLGIEAAEQHKLLSSYRELTRQPVGAR
jgi:4-hydroxy-tetrahydrodipicolinate synthase